MTLCSDEGQFIFFDQASFFNIFSRASIVLGKSGQSWTWVSEWALFLLSVRSMIAKIFTSRQCEVVFPLERTLHVHLSFWYDCFSSCFLSLALTLIVQCKQLSQFPSTCNRQLLPRAMYILRVRVLGAGNTVRQRVP